MMAAAAAPHVVEGRWPDAEAWGVSDGTLEAIEKRDQCARPRDDGSQVANPALCQLCMRMCVNMFQTESARASSTAAAAGTAVSCCETGVASSSATMSGRLSEFRR